MQKLIPVLAAALFAFNTASAQAASTTATVNAIDANGVGKKIGTLKLADTKNGLRITPNLTSLPPGAHGFHVHANPSCGAAPGPDGQLAAGMAGGGHYDPMKTAKHLGPMSTEGHQGDLPVLTVDDKGRARKAVMVPHLNVATAEGHAIMIHAGGDNYADQPAPLGGGGRIACAVVK